MTATAIVDVRGVTKAFGQGRTVVEVLRSVDLTALTGESIAVVGRSGCGKSTLLSILGLMMSADSGEVWIDGVDIAGLQPNEVVSFRRRKIGFVFQQFHLVSYLDAAENVELALQYTETSRTRRRQAVTEILERTGLAQRARHRPHELSGGERQRVAIARALVKQPAILLADEPTGALDRHSGDEFLGLLDLVRDSTAVVLATHNPEVAAWADRTVVFTDDGRLAP